MTRLPPWLLVLVLGCGLLFPLLGSYGLWDPHEIQVADVAQDVASAKKYTDVTLDGKYGQRSVLTLWLVALGFQVFGVGEFAGRVFVALAGVLTLLVGYRVIRRLVGPQAAVLGAFVLGTTPTFLFQSRQLVSEVPYYAALLAAVGGLAAFIWPADGKRCRLDLVIGGLGLVGGALAKGVVLGAVFPVASLFIAVALSWRTRNAPDPGSPAPEGAALGPELTVGQAFLSSAKGLGLTLVVAGGLIALVISRLKGPAFHVLGSELQRVAAPQTFEIPLKELGFAFFPWIGLVPLALAVLVSGQTADPPQRTRTAFPQLLLLVLVAAGYLLASFWPAYFGRIRYPALPFLAVAVGVALWQVRAQQRPLHAVWGLLAAGVIATLSVDFIMDPQTLAFSHLLDYAKYPIELDIKLVLRIFGVLLAIIVFFALAGSPRPILLRPHEGPAFAFRGVLRALNTPLNWLVRLGRRALSGAIWALNLVGEGLRFVGGSGGKRYWAMGGVASVGFAGWCAFFLTPSLSLHMSNKALFQVFHQCRSGKEKLAQYQVPGRGAAYYNKGQIEEVGSQSQLFELLRQPDRWFILVPASNLAAIDQAARQSKVTYHVLDDRSSQYLLVSNRLEGKCAADHNPLRRFVLSSPPKPRKPLVANFEGRVKLIGYDVPDVVTRGGKFTITLYFQVLGQMPSGYKLFIHFDQPANRFHGDHEPLDGKYPTQYWLPGDYIVDPHDVEIPLITTPSGTYNMYVGFWLGEGRLKVIEGPNDGVNRVPLGVLRVR